MTTEADGDDVPNDFENDASADQGEDMGQSLLVRKRGVFKIPFFALMFSYVTASVLVVGVIGWKFTLDAASSKLDDLALKVQEQAANEISAYIWDYAHMLAKITSYQREMFLTNEWSFLPERREYTLAAMLLVLNQFRSWTVDIFLHPYPDGALYGFFYSDSEPNMLQKWEQTGASLYTSAYYAHNNSWVLKQNWTDPGNQTVENPGTNGTLLYEGTADYRYAINFSDFNTFKIGVVYPWNLDVYKTSVAVVQNPVTSEIILFGNDWTLTFLGKKISEVLYPIGYHMFMAAIETSTGRLIATSNSSLSLISQTSSGSGVLSYFDAQNHFLEDFRNWIVNESEFGLASSPSESVKALVKNLNSTGIALLRSRYLNNTNYSLRLGLVEVPYDPDDYWLSVQYMDLDAVAAPLRQASKLTEVSIFTIMGGVVIVSTIFAFTVARQIEIVVRQILTLKDLRFQEVLNREKGVKVTSFVMELADLQHSFFELVLTFASKIRMRRLAQERPLQKPDMAGPAIDQLAPVSNVVALPPPIVQ
ncbi:hypothetical protein HDU67_003880 [Dinochytrium kinnereticum]|nr:hypothetical protein HDU67_003880 [Dinochytrium kinnereticum]